MNPTANAQTNVLLDDLLRNIRRTLRSRLDALYLYGSLVSGDFDKDISDIVMLAVTADDIDDEDLNHLAAMHREFAARNRAWDDRIEVQYLSAAGLKAFRSKLHRMA